ncbi:hypothetical protein NDU88_006745 [Pleurodeles waltl]|uniref:Uncharacterized protein n=1 Tax=Pleurodeles waltl TaxID=8319 RepID=A0AAV7NU72_PLEWA|nr:hypothetical protein NDU88_006745 [Pleurodeles waltl]
MAPGLGHPGDLQGSSAVHSPLRPKPADSVGVARGHHRGRAATSCIVCQTMGLAPLWAHLRALTLCSPPSQAPPAPGTQKPPGTLTPPSPQLHLHSVRRQGT